MPDLVSFYTLASLMEGRELSRMTQNDWNANVSKLVVAVAVVVIVVAVAVVVVVVVVVVIVAVVW